MGSLMTITGPLFIPKGLSSLITSLSLSQAPSDCTLTFSHSCKCKNNSRKRRSLTRERGRAERGERRKGKTGITALLLVPPLPHTGTFDTFQRTSSTSSHSHTLKVTQTDTTQEDTVTRLQPVLRQHEIRLCCRLEDSPLVHPCFSCLSAFIYSPWLRPPSGAPCSLCVDRWTVAGLEVGLWRVHRARWCRRFKVFIWRKGQHPKCDEWNI